MFSSFCRLKAKKDQGAHGCRVLGNLYEKVEPATGKLLCCIAEAGVEEQPGHSLSRWGHSLQSSYT